MTEAELKSKLRYYPETGEVYYKDGWYWRAIVRNKGKRYARLQMGGHRTSLARWIVLYMTGQWPEKGLVVDHIDGDPDNNKWDNLRVCTQGMNCRNKHKSVLNTSGKVGVSWSSAEGRWIAQIGRGGKSTSNRIGCFLLKRDAIAAREAAERELGYTSAQ